MGELKFVLKCLVFATLVLAISQIKTEKGTLETQVQAELLSTGTADFVNKAAQGGAKLIRHGIDYAKLKINHRQKNEEKPEAVSDQANSQLSEETIRPQSAPSSVQQTTDENSDLDETE